MINDNFDLNNTGVSNALQTRDLPRHRWYFYKEGFSPSLVKKAIEENNLSPNDIILDPFNGSGTVTLTAAIEGIKSYGFEVNPFTSFLSQTKAYNVSKKEFKILADKTSLECLKGKNSFLNTYSTFTKNKHKGSNKWLFNKDVLKSYNGGYQSIEGNKTESSALVNLALISAIMKNGNAKKDGKCLRYKPNWESYSYNKSSFLESFENEISTIFNDLDVEVATKPIIENGDSRVLIDGLENKFKLCITSPPYLNTFDYTDIYRPELFLGGFIKSSAELRNLRHQTVRSHLNMDWTKVSDSNFGMAFDTVFKKIISKKDQLMHIRIPEMIIAYFEDMKLILSSLRAKADDNASLWFVVSTSAYANEHIPVDLILADIATQVGWNLKEIGVLREIQKRKTRHSPDIDKLRESVVILTT